jgi:hypothetical protein
MKETAVRIIKEDIEEEALGAHRELFNRLRNGEMITDGDIAELTEVMEEYAMFAEDAMIGHIINEKMADNFDIYKASVEDQLRELEAFRECVRRGELVKKTAGEYSAQARRLKIAEEEVDVLRSGIEDGSLISREVFREKLLEHLESAGPEARSGIAQVIELLNE